MKFKPVLLIVLDGWGLGDGGPSDAIAQAHTPHFDFLWNNYARTQLCTHGHHVGLPAKKDLGGSEVGHLTMGAGQILDQGPTRINKAIKDGSFFQSSAMKTVFSRSQNQGALHLVGLLSDGNIHAHIDHFIAMVEHAYQLKVPKLRLHVLLDGRDVAIQTAHVYVQRMQQLFAQCEGVDYALASGVGRELMTMDRDQDWSKVQAGWQLMVHGEAEHQYQDPLEAIVSFRMQKPDLIDQDMPAFVVVDEEGEAIGRIQDGDSVVMMNFRADRAIEMTEAFCVDNFSDFDRGQRPDIFFAGMMVYDEDRNLPENQLMTSTKVAEPFGKRLVEAGLKQFRLTETQKFPHVTFFFNGGYRKPLDASLEDYILISSDKGISFADKPEMKAAEIAQTCVSLLEKQEYDFGLINFANADMVGHCGDIKATILAVEAVDAALKEITDALKKVGGAALITADHGNADAMIHHASHGDEPSTKHSINPVPCVLFDPEYSSDYTLSQDIEGESAGLANIAATLFEMLGLDVPEDLERSLVCNK
ncbi:MAG: 2,3-bisphosphoglycerate-independent phosphoglycerate mutase [Mariprofundaceae bacterium]|nr:2,3-bisphosphoglycerate-independent phosphoglycerate mutase [Mariprofundaceae bacterium]